MKIINRMSRKSQRTADQLKIIKAKNITNSLNLSITESKKPPKGVFLLVKRAILPSIPSNIPVINTKIEKKNRFPKYTKAKKLKIEKKNMITVAKFGETLILINPFANEVTNGLKIRLNRSLEAIVN